MSRNHGAVWWTELATTDVQGALKYYRAVFGWHFESFPMPIAGGGVYYVGRQGDTPVIGVMDLASVPEREGMPPHWFSYFAVDNLEAALKETEARGGTIQRAPFDVPYVGRIAIVTDPAGAATGLIRPA